jgi:hypothetical protein
MHALAIIKRLAKAISKGSIPEFLHSTECVSTRYNS